ncbi:MAG: hypothetical protein GY805_30780, partial [Chloroflexi bacterium]|nr:hypothetical protein [Chloroflexota bacterium]
MYLSPLTSAGIIIFTIIAAAILLGWLIVRYSVASQPFSGTPLEFAFSSLTIGVIVIGWLAFVLAELGKFSILTLTLLWGGLSLSLFLQMRRNQVG